MPGLLNNINYLKEVSVFPCANPGPVILAVSALEAAGPVLVELSSFSCLDIIKTRAGISWRCGRQLKSIIKAAHGAKVIDKVHHLYSFAAPVEQALWYWFLAEQTTNFLANWTSLVYKSAKCIPSDLDVHTESSKPRPSLHGPHSEDYVDYEIESGDPFNFYHIIGGFTVPAGWYWQTYFSIQTVPYRPGGGTGFDLWLDVGLGAGHDYPRKRFTKELLASTTHGIYAASGQVDAFAPLGRVIWKAEFDDYQKITSGHMITSISPLPILEHEPAFAGCFHNDFGLGGDFLPF